MMVGFFIWEYPFGFVGGSGTYPECIKNEFVELGHDVSVFHLNSGDAKTEEAMEDLDFCRVTILDASKMLPMLVTYDLEMWGSNIHVFSDIFIYNVLSASKFVNQLIKKEGCAFDVACVYDWLSSIDEQRKR